MARAHRRVAKLNLKLDKSAEPLPADSTFRVRYRSAFGLKYLGDHPRRPSAVTGMPRPRRTAAARRQSQHAGRVRRRLQHLRHRRPARTAAGSCRASATPSPARGASLNQAIEALNPLFANLSPSRRRSRTRRRSWSASSPSSPTPPGSSRRSPMDNAELFTNGAIAFGAISSDPQALQDTISGRPARPRGRARARCPCSARSSPTSPSSRACCAPASRTCARALPPQPGRLIGARCCRARCR